MKRLQGVLELLPKFCIFSLVTLQKDAREVFHKNIFLKVFLKFAGKHLCESLFFNKVAGLQIY